VCFEYYEVMMMNDLISSNPPAAACPP